MRGKRVALPLQEGAPYDKFTYDEFTAINTKALRELRDHGAKASRDLCLAMDLIDELAEGGCACDLDYRCLHCRARDLIQEVRGKRHD